MLYWISVAVGGVPVYIILRIACYPCLTIIPGLVALVFHRLYVVSTGVSNVRMPLCLLFMFLCLVGVGYVYLRKH